MAGIKRFAVMFLAASASFLSQLGERAGHRASMFQYEALRAVDHGLVELVGLVVAPAILRSSRMDFDSRDFPRLPAPTMPADTIVGNGEELEIVRVATESSCRTPLSPPEASPKTSVTFGKTCATLGNDCRSALARRGGRSGFHIGQTLPPSAIGRDIPVSAQRPRRAASPSNTVATGGGLDNGLVDAPGVWQGGTSNEFKIFAYTDDGAPTTRDDDVFFTELLKLDGEGTPQWESDGGLSAYRPLPNVETPSPAVPLDLVSGNGVINATALYEEVAFPIAAGSTSVFFTVNASSHAGYYTGTYAPASSGSYQASVTQLLPGGLEANLWDNHGLLGAPVVHRVDPEVSFNWGSSGITSCGQGPVSARWQGKLLAPTSETFTFFVRAQGGVRLFIDHRVVIDAWADNLRAGKERLVPVDLVAGRYHDVRLEYRRQQESSSIQMMWASTSVPPSVIPSSAWHYATPIAGSPFDVNVLPRERDVRKADNSIDGEGFSPALAKTKDRPLDTITQAKDLPAMVSSNMTLTATAQSLQPPWPDPALLEEPMSREGVLVAPADSAASPRGLRVGSSFFGMSDGTMVGGVPWTLQPEMETDMAEALPEAEPEAFISWAPLDDGYSQTQTLPDADSRALVPWVSPHKDYLLTHALSHAEPGAVVSWVSRGGATVYSCCSKLTYGVQHGLHGWERHLFDAFLAASSARRAASTFDHLSSTAEASGVSTDPARAVESAHSIVDTSASQQQQQEPSPHEVAIVEAAGLTPATGDEGARAGDRGAASSSQGVPTALTNDVPVAQPTKPEEPAWDKEMARLAYVACRTLVAYAWISRYHPSGTSKLTGLWVVWCLQLTSSRDFNGFLAAYAWPVGRLLVALAWSVAVALWNVINNVFVTTMASSAVLGYVCFKIWLADNRLETDSFYPEDDYWRITPSEPTPRLPGASSQEALTESSLPLESEVATGAGESHSGRAKHDHLGNDEPEQC